MNTNISARMSSGSRMAVLLAYVISATATLGVAQDAQDEAPARTQESVQSEVLPAGAAPLAEAGPTSKALYIQGLRSERERWAGRRISVIDPLLMLGGGVALSALSFRYLYVAQICGSIDGGCGWSPQRIGGLILGTTGVALAAAGAAFLTVRIVRRAQRRRALERIDEELRVATMRASIAPWIGLAAGGPFGLSGRVTF
jgi:hypothetical protein